MINIFLVGEDKNFADELYNGLSDYGDVMLVSKDKIMKTDEKYSFFIYDNLATRENSESKSIVIFEDKFKNPKNYPINDKNIIVNSKNQNALKLLKNVKSQIIVCGMSLRDTVSISSITGDKASISLQRTLNTLNEKQAQMCEITVNNQSNNEYLLMCIAAILLLSGHKG